MGLGVGGGGRGVIGVVDFVDLRPPAFENLNNYLTSPMLLQWIAKGGGKIWSSFTLFVKLPQCLGA